MCIRAKVTRAACSRNSQSHIHQSTKFMTANHKILQEDGESLNGFKVNHAKRQLHEKRREKIQGSFSIPKKVQRFFTPTIHWNLEKASEDLQRNHCASTLCRLEKRNCRKSSTKSQRATEQRWAESVECSCHLLNVQDLLSDGKKLHKNVALKNNSLGQIHVGQAFHSEQMSNTIRYQRKIRRGSISSARKCSQASLWAMLCIREEAGKETCSWLTLRNYRRTTHPMCVQ